MRARIALLIAGSLGLWLLMSYPAHVLGGEAAVFESAVAVALCLVPTVATLAWAGMAANARARDRCDVRVEGPVREASVLLRLVPNPLPTAWGGGSAAVDRGPLALLECRHGAVGELAGRSVCGLRERRALRCIGVASDPRGQWGPIGHKDEFCAQSPGFDRKIRGSAVRVDKTQSLRFAGYSRAIGLVARVIRVGEVPGSNPGAPIAGKPC